MGDRWWVGVDDGLGNGWGWMSRSGHGGQDRAMREGRPSGAPSLALCGPETLALKFPLCPRVSEMVEGERAPRGGATRSGHP